MAIVKLGILGLGRMGGAIAERVMRAGHHVVGYDLDTQNSQEAAALGVQVVSTVADVAKNTSVVWLMVPAGAPVDAVIGELLPHLQADAIIIDGGNSLYLDSIRRAQALAAKNISFLDCGTSGGLHGRELGFCLMVGGEKAAYDSVYELFKVIAMTGGVGYMGPSGAGHYVKMVHNGIEYGLLQAYAEGFELLKEGTFKDVPLDLELITRVWNHGSIVRSWLLGLSHEVFQHDQTLDTISGDIQESGTGKWTVEDAHKNNVPVPVIEKSLAVRAWSRDTGGNFATKVVAMVRHQFGGHAFKKVIK